MNEKKLTAYFKTQLHALMRRSASEPDGFRAYFANREPKDDEILGLLAVNAMADSGFPQREFFPTPVEALAALSPAARSLICREFRKELKGRLRHLPRPKPRVALTA